MARKQQKELIMNKIAEAYKFKKSTKLKNDLINRFIELIGDNPDKKDLELLRSILPPEKKPKKNLTEWMLSLSNLKHSKDYVKYMYFDGKYCYTTNGFTIYRLRCMNKRSLSNGIGFYGKDFTYYGNDNKADFNQFFIDKDSSTFKTFNINELDVLIKGDDFVYQIEDKYYNKDAIDIANYNNKEQLGYYSKQIRQQSIMQLEISSIVDVIIMNRG